MKKKLLLCLSILLIAAMAITGTVAYFTDTDEALNVMTFGNVEIELIESQRDGADGLEDFEQGKVLLPIVGSAQGEKDGFGMSTAANYVDKIVTVKNTGKNDAWIRVIVAVPSVLEENFEGTSASGNVLHWNTGTKFAPNGDGVVPETQYTWESVGTDTIDGEDYNFYAFYYDTTLAPGDTTTAAFVGFYLDSRVDFDGINYTFDGKVVDYDFSDGVVIPVMAQAVQASGFETAAEAFTAAGMPTNPWATVSMWDGTADTAWYTGDSTEYTISTAAELAGLAEIVNGGNSLQGVTINLTSDVNLAHKAWTPIGNSLSTVFAGTFNGNGHTVSALKVDVAEGAGLFGFLRPWESGSTPTITNVKVEDADITAKHYAGVIAAYAYGDITNCSVEDATINCVDEAGEDGDKVGSIVGYVGTEGVKSDIVGNTAKNVTITANRDAGTIAGFAPSNANVSDNIADNVTVIASGFGSGANLGGVVGRS